MPKDPVAPDTTAAEEAAENEGMPPEEEELTVAQVLAKAPPMNLPAGFLTQCTHCGLTIDGPTNKAPCPNCGAPLP